MQKFDETNLNGESAVENTIYDDAITLVRREMDVLMKSRGLDDDQLDRLGKLVRIYGALKDDLRADNKDGIKGGSST